MTFHDLMGKVFTTIIQPVLIFLFGLAALLFIWGIVEYIRKSKEGKDTKEGGIGIVWGLVGMVIMISPFGIIRIIQGTIGVKQTPEQRAIETRFSSTTDNVRVE